MQGEENMQALMLAAGMGRRMGKYTEAVTKCMLEVSGKTLLERTVEALKAAGIHKLVMVLGWGRERLVKYIEDNITGIEFEYIINENYATTNNIYSLYLAREALAREDTILLESDLVYDKQLLCEMLASPEKNLVAVAKFEQWMDGTVTRLSEDGTILEFIEKKDFKFQNAEEYYKTVNIYKFSKEFSQNQYIPFLEAYIKAYGTNQYYELVLKALAHLSNSHLKAHLLKNIKWYEIDDTQDLDIANTIFSNDNEKLYNYERRYGGYWRFPELKDFCYLVNPYFPTLKMQEQMKYFYTPLLTQYPSGMNTQKLLAGKMFDIEDQYVLVGNGAAEFINVLGSTLEGSMAVPSPTFNEYIRCFQKCNIRMIPTIENSFQLDKSILCKAACESDILAIINPDNPSGSFLCKEDLIEILENCKEHNTICIIDESFADFVESHQRYSLLQNGLLEQYPQLVVIKSISKSYGVPGLRLGVLATSNLDLLKKIQSALPIWNINSFAEYFLQVFSIYKKEYWKACDQIALQREQLQKKLSTIGFLNVIPSQANYIMCKVNGYSSRELALTLLNQDNILIKDLSTKSSFEGKSYIRIAVKNQEENELLYRSLKKLAVN